jgi:outer membrane biosynthesis protein TonB
MARSMAAAALTHVLILGAAVVVAPRAAGAGARAEGELLFEAPPVAAVAPPPEPDVPEPEPEPPPVTHAPPAPQLGNPPPEDPYERSPNKPEAPVAEAPKILTTDDPSADTGTFASGEGNGFGIVAGGGRGKGRGGNGRGAAGGTGTGGGRSPMAPAPDRSRPARILDVSSDNCEFPDDAGDVNNAVVTVQVTVGSDSRPASVAVVRTPSRSFSRAAKHCVMRRTYQAALDHDGHKIPGRTGPVIVRFTR